MMSFYLSDDLISEIFTRLPVKSLLRFRSLSKSWYSHISSPGFIRTHSSRSPQKLLIKHRLGQSECLTLHSEDQLPLCPERGYMDILQAEVPRKSYYCYVVGICNGILCLCHRIAGISLWNPSIGRQLAVPNCHLPVWDINEFGFDPNTDDYKIVCIFFPKENGGPHSASVYAIKTGTWCAIDSPVPFLIEVDSASCFVNGALHWAVRRHAELDDCDCNIGCLYILTFDLSTHVFGTIAMPQPIYTSWPSGLGKIQGSLRLVSTDCEDNIWIWAKRDASWSVVFKLKIDEVGGSITGVLQQSNNGDMLLLYESFRSHFYNPKIGARSRLAKFNAFSSMVRMEMFVESLYLLDMKSAFESNHLSLITSRWKEMKQNSTVDVSNIEFGF